MRRSRSLKRFGPIASLERAGSAVLEAPFIDVQGLDPGLEGRWWNSKLSRRSKRSGNPALDLGQHRLDSLALAPRLTLTLETRRLFNPRCLRRSPFGKSQLINGKNFIAVRPTEWMPWNYRDTLGACTTPG